MRQTILAAGIVPKPASEELLTLVEELRPWSNEDLVTARLRSWADRHWGPCSLTPGVADGAAEVAAVLCLYGRAIDPPDEVTALWVTFAMLRRVARKRPPTGTDPITDFVKVTRRPRPDVGSRPQAPVSMMAGWPSPSGGSSVSSTSVASWLRATPCPMPGPGFGGIRASTPSTRRRRAGVDVAAPAAQERVASSTTLRAASIGSR
jgi:hypothetical protein